MHSSDASDVMPFAISATSAAEGACRCGPIVRRSLTERVDSTGSGALMLSHTPVASVTSIVGTGGSTVTAYDLSPGAGIVYGVGSGAYDVTYVAGRFDAVADVTDDISTAVLIIAKHLWETRRGQAGRPGALGDSEPVPSYGFAVPRRAQELLAQYAQLAVC